MDAKKYTKILARILAMGVLMIMLITPSAKAIAEIPDPAEPWREDFNGPLAEEWFWINENYELWRLVEAPEEPAGFLEIITSHSSTGGENLLLRPVATGDFMVKTHIIFNPFADFQFAGLVVYQDGFNFLQFGRAFCSFEGACVGNGIYFDKILGGSWVDSNFATGVDIYDEAYLRLEKRGENLKAFFSYEGVTWFEIGQHTIPADFQINGIGLTTSQNFADEDIFAYFDFVEVSEGWGFLPEGFHDFNQGEAPRWGCNGGGWAVDPDDRNTDLWVEFNVDGSIIGGILANEYRPDLVDPNLCIDGNCGFAASLLGAISYNEPHVISAYAQDIPSGEWVLLNNSPLSLTCIDYDILSYDLLTGATLQITDTNDRDEFNPSWSPNGKKVAHDVLFTDDTFGIYITDIKTGITTPLTGAESGNDAVWSPSGQFLAFDRVESELDVVNLYLIPPNGGTPTLLRQNGMSADWAPNGRRLVFQDTTDGSIRTISYNGKSRETFIVDYGEYPVWSPDGNWIAYNAYGDIWKIRVSLNGIPFGEPIQMTNSFMNEGQPTWSMDSQFITYHAGLNQFYDLWSVPSAGGEPIRLTGVPRFGDYDPAYARDFHIVAYAGMSMDVQEPPEIDLRVNYGHDWVESFYESGHDIEITVTESDGITVKAIAISRTQQDYFQTRPEEWTPAPPDLQPYDWVFVRVDNGATAQLQLGEILGEVRFDLDSISGTILATWITEPVQVECLDWGSGMESPYGNKDGGFHLTDGNNPYACSWEGEWDVQPWQDIGVGYFTSDGHWVANAFRDERWMATWIYDPPLGIFSEGIHNYYFSWAYTVPLEDSLITDPLTIELSGLASIYPGYVLVRPNEYAPQQAWTGSGCEVVSPINPLQPLRFILGWVNDFSMTYDEAVAHFESFTVDVFWDDTSAGPGNWTMSEIAPYYGPDSRAEIFCAFTDHP